MTRALNLAAVEMRAFSKESKVTPFLRAIRLPISRQIAELNENSIGRTGNKGRGLLKEVMDEHVN
jgi:hypothetical protein